MRINTSELQYTLCIEVAAYLGIWKMLGKIAMPKMKLRFTYNTQRSISLLVILHSIISGCASKMEDIPLPPINTDKSNQASRKAHADQEKLNQLDILKNENKIIVDGAVNSPGTYHYINELTAENAISLAGGITRCGKMKFVNVTRLTDGNVRQGQLRINELLVPGDIIRMPCFYF